MIATRNEEKSYTQSSCTCPCCCPSKHSHNGWKMRRKMSKNAQNRHRAQSSIEDINEQNNNNPVLQDYNLPTNVISESNSDLRSTNEADSINFKIANNNRNMLICGDEPGLFSPKISNIFDCGNGLNFKFNFLPNNATHSSFATFVNFLVIFISLLLLTMSPVLVDAFPTNDCDWSGR